MSKIISIILSLLVICYASKAPDLVWDKHYDPSDRADDSWGVVVDETGNIYVTGYRHNGRDNDWCTLKYDPNGVRQWVSTYDSHSSRGDWAFGLTIGPEGNIYVCGGNGSNYLIQRYDSDGRKQKPWSIEHLPGADWARDIAIDAQGNIYVTGADTNGVTNQYLTVKLDSKGMIKWPKVYNTASNDEAWGIALDKDSYIYVTGFSGSGCYTIKYDPEGGEIWRNPYTHYDETGAYDIATDGDGNAYIAGYAYTKKTRDYDFLIVKYASNGDLLWERTPNFSSEDKALGVAVDEAGYIYAAGFSKEEGRYNFQIVKYSPGGDSLWNKTYDSEDDDIARDIALDPNRGYIYVTGLSRLWPLSEYRTLKYRQYLSIKGYIKDEAGEGIEDVKVELKGAVSDLYVTGGDGYYEFNNLPCDENYTVTPSKIEEGVIWEFSPEKLFYTPLYKDEPSQDFVATKTGIEEKPPISSGLLLKKPTLFRKDVPIEYEIPERRSIQLIVYNSNGIPVRTLDKGKRAPGVYKIVWDRRDENGKEVSSGVYFLRLIAGKDRVTEKFILMK